MVHTNWRCYHNGDCIHRCSRQKTNVNFLRVSLEFPVHAASATQYVGAMNPSVTAFVGNGRCGLKYLQLPTGTSDSRRTHFLLVYDCMNGTGIPEQCFFYKRESSAVVKIVSITTKFALNATFYSSLHMSDIASKFARLQCI